MQKQHCPCSFLRVGAIWPAVSSALLWWHSTAILATMNSTISKLPLSDHWKMGFVQMSSPTKRQCSSSWGTSQNNWCFGVCSLYYFCWPEAWLVLAMRKWGTRSILVCRSLPFHLATCVRLASGWPRGHILFISHTCLLKGPRAGRAMFTFNSFSFPWLQNSTWFHVFRWLFSMLEHAVL